MHRSLILDLIRAYEMRYPEESAVVDKIRSFVELNPNCFDRELAEGHVTGSAWILDTEHSSALLTHHKKLNIWVQLGGHADGDSDIARVAMREAEEESGLQKIDFLLDEIFDIDIHEIPARGDEIAHLHYDCRFLLQARDKDFVVSDESHNLAWIDLSEMENLTSEESILRMVKKSSFLK